MQTAIISGEFFSSNPAWVLLDVLMRCGYTLDEIDMGSFARPRRMRTS